MRKTLSAFPGKCSHFLHVYVTFLLSYIFSLQCIRPFTWKHSHKTIYRWGTILVILFFSLITRAQDSSGLLMPVIKPVEQNNIGVSDGMVQMPFNYTSFPKKQQGNLEKWKKYNTPEDYNHPEFGYLPYSTPGTNCVEVLSKRKANERYFRSTEDSTKVFVQKSWGDLNIFKNGKWLAIDPKLSEAGNGKYVSGITAARVSFDIPGNNIGITTPFGKVSFNNWTLWAKKKGQLVKLDNPDWSHYTIGEDGMYVTNIFKGIDAEIRVLRGAIKTNFVIRNIGYGDFDELHFRDVFNNGAGTWIRFSNDASKKKGIGELTVFLNNQDAVKVAGATAFPKGGTKDQMVTMEYEVYNNGMNIVVPRKWIDDNIGKHALVIDPLVTATNALAAAAMSSMYNSSCGWGGSCNYTLDVVQPAATTITNVNSDFSMLANSPCLLSDGAFRFSLNGCISPAPGQVWICNYAETGVCGTGNFSIMGSVQSCLPAPSCVSQTMTFGVSYYRKCVGPTGCDASCLGAYNPWTVTLTCRTVELSDATNAISIISPTTCQGQTIDLSIAGKYGVPPYTYKWSNDPSGTPVISTNNVFSFSNNAGSYPYYVSVTDACNQTFNGSRTIIVNPPKAVDRNVTICANQLPYTWNGISVSAGGTAAATYTMPSALTGCDSTTTLNLTVNPLKTGVANITICANQLPYTWNGISVSAGGTAVATYTMPSALTGCDSTTTLNLTVNPLKTGVANITICADALPYTWNGISVSAGGTAVATYTMPSALTGCDSTTTLNLTVNPLKIGVANITICANQLPYTWNGISVSSGGTAVATYTMPSALTGCDSTTTLNLTVNPLKTGVANITICADALPYTWNGISVSAGGTAVATYTMPSALTGCDSTTTLNLTVNPLKTGVANITICADALPYTWNGISVSAGGAAAATYTIPSALTGCDSTTTLNLTVNPLKTGVANIAICADQLPYTWNGQTITAGGNAVATYTIPSALTGCDSTTTLNLTVNPLKTGVSNITICASQLPYTWNGQTIAAGGNAVATYTMPSALTGCDSTTTLNLTVNTLPAMGTQPGDATILIGENTSFAITASGTGISYQWQVNAGSGFVNVTDGGVYSGATAATLNITNALLSMNGYHYRCVVTGTCAPAVTSNEVLLTVNKHPQTISFQSYTNGSTLSKTYGDADFSAAATASSGLTVTYNSSNAAVATISTTGQISIKGAGSAMIAVTQPGDNFYLPATITLFIQVNKKDLQVVADNKTRPYGEPNPALTISYTGFVNGENKSVLTEPVPATGVVLTTMPGTYPITLTGGTAANYNLLLTNGSFVVTGAIVYINEQPKNQDACESGMAGFTIAASAASPIVTLAYQWQYSNNGTSWQNIAGATGDTYITAAANSRYVRCLVLAPGTTAPTQAAYFTVNPLPDVKAFKSNDLDCNLGSAKLNATGAVSYNWSPLTGMSNASVASPVVSPTEATMYTVVGTDDKGCVNSDSVKVEIFTTKNGENVVANAFTPNGDGKNDCFGIKYWGVIQKIEFSIYNRDGRRIFHTTTPGACWDGTYNGQPQPTGTYVYSIRALTQCGVIDRKGTVTLIR